MYVALVKMLLILSRVLLMLALDITLSLILIELLVFIDEFWFD